MKRYLIKDLLEQKCENKCENLFEKKLGFKRTKLSPTKTITKIILEEKSSIKPLSKYPPKKNFLYYSRQKIHVKKSLKRTLQHDL